MVNTNKSEPVRLQWYENQIEDFKKEYPNKTFSLLLWNEDEFEIARQINKALNENVDYVLTEVMPHNLPTICSIKEYNFLIDRFIFIEPNLNKKGDFDNKITGKALVIDKDFKKTYFKNHAIQDNLSKFFDSVVVIEEVIETGIVSNLLDCSEIFIFTIKPALLHLSYRLYKKGKCTKRIYINPNTFSEISLINNDVEIIIIDEGSSLRNLFQNFIQPKLIKRNIKTFSLEDYHLIKNKFSNYSEEIIFKNRYIQKNRVFHLHKIDYLYLLID